MSSDGGTEVARDDRNLPFRIRKSKMQITFIAPTVNMNGGTRVIATYARKLASMGHVVRVVSPPSPRIPLRRKLKSLLIGNGWPSNSQPPKSHFDGSGIDHHVLDRWRPVTDGDVPDADVVIATWWETAEWVNALGPSKGAKAYFIQHHELFSHVPAARCHATYRMPLHKIVIARWLKNVMREQYSDDVVDLVSNSVDQDLFFAPTRGKQPVPTIGFVYSSAAFKGLGVALSAIRSLREEIPDLRVISFGAQHPKAHLPLPDGALFSYSPPQGKIRELYSQCDAWMAASRSEGFYLPAMEAMACRTPVVSTRTGWPEEAILSGENGVLVDIDDDRGLASGVKWVLSLSESEWRKLSDNAYATATASTWDQSAEQFERALLHACRRASKGEIGGKPMTPNVAD